MKFVYVCLRFLTKNFPRDKILSKLRDQLLRPVLAVLLSYLVAELALEHKAENL